MNAKRVLLCLSIAMVCCGTFTSCGNDGDGENVPEGGQAIQADCVKYLPGWWGTDECEGNELISFDTQARGSVYRSIDEPVGDDEYELSASGSYTVNGNSLCVKYTDVSVYRPDGGKSYRGFTDGESRTVTYTIKSISNYTMTIVDELGKTLIYEKYKEL